MSPQHRDLRARAAAALRSGFVRSTPGVELDARGYARRIEDNLLPNVDFERVRSSFEEGAGRESDEKLRAVHSSAALVVNSFQPWMDAPEALLLAGRTGFSSLRFEAKFPVFASPRATPAHLDLLADGPQGGIAVESKLTEHLRAPRPTFSPTYDRFLRGPDACAWSSWIERLRQRPESFAWLDAAQLVKHALGLRRARPSIPTTLLYLYWEPTNAAELASFAEHRREVEGFARSVASDPVVAFESTTHGELWGSWLRVSAPPWLPEHARRLLDRYAVAM